MKIKVCDLCHIPVNDLNKTEVIIKDYKGVSFGPFGVGTYPEKRKMKGVICDDCLNKLRGIQSNIPLKKD